MSGNPSSASDAIGNRLPSARFLQHPTGLLAMLGAMSGAMSALVPGFALAIGLVTIGEAPTALQLAGFAAVMLGFWCVLRR